MPIGIPKVPYQMPGQTYSDWISIYDRLYRERIISWVVALMMVLLIKS